MKMYENYRVTHISPLYRTTPSLFKFHVFFFFPRKVQSIDFKTVQKSL